MRDMITSCVRSIWESLTLLLLETKFPQPLQRKPIARHFLEVTGLNVTAHRSNLRAWDPFGKQTSVISEDPIGFWSS